MNTIYIHSGLPKCGSSALQVFFAQNIVNLRSVGIDYFNLEDMESAQSGGITSGNGALLSRWLLPRNHPWYYAEGKILYENLMNLINVSDSEFGLISSEIFVNLPLERINWIKDEFSSLGVTTKFIFYARRQDQYLVSAYLQQVKRHGYTSALEEFIHETMEKTHFLKYYSFTQQIERIVGKGNVLAFIYEITKDFQLGLAGHFVQSLTGSLPNWTKNAPTVNTSPTILELKLLLMANRFGPRMRFSDFLIEDSVISGRSKAYQQSTIISNDLVFDIINYFAEENKKFEEFYCAGTKFPNLVQKKSESLEEFSFSANEVMDIISGFLVRYDRRLDRLEGIIGNLLKRSG